MNYDLMAALEGELDSVAFEDEGVEAARNACVAGAPLAAAAITAAAYYDNPLTGARALVACMGAVSRVPQSLDDWLAGPARAVPLDPDARDSVLSAPGFGHVDFEGYRTVLGACERLVGGGSGVDFAPRCRSYLEHAEALAARGAPLNTAGLVALASADHGVEVDEAERWFLLRRMSTAMRAAQETRRRGLHQFPFLSDRHVYEGHTPRPRRHDLQQLTRELGLEY